MLRIGLIGLGNQGTEYLIAQDDCKSLQIVTGFDINEQTRNRASEDWPALQLTGSLDELMGHNLDGLILALPHHVYAEEWDKLVSLKLPMLKEKPLGRNLTEARSFVRKARENGCPLQTAIQRREQPSYKYLLDVLKTRKVNDVHFMMHLGFEQPVNSNQSSEQWRGKYNKVGRWGITGLWLSHD
ncbi:MAG: Gfo/Idh/MocA family oxidoreductase [Ghiorsea sp.]|nr:Gfo/Idh/MocA family oxidoreductase [Ghiorsea sp.]